MPNMPDKANLTMIGCGKMGGAMMRGWLDKGLIHSAHIYAPHPIDEELTAYNEVHAHQAHSSLNPAMKDSDLIILSVKPQIMGAVLEELKPGITTKHNILSIAAGLDSTFFASNLGQSHPFIRVMPNTPCAIGQGMSVLFSNPYVSDDIKAQVTRLFEAVGDAFWIEDENQMNAVTAISGSGPAYLFHFIEALTEAAQSLGFDEEKATRLARQTIIGSAALAASDSDIPAETLRQNVTSPGGTTEAGLEVLMGKDALTNIIKDTTQAALERGIDLNK